MSDFAREPFEWVEIDQDYCTRTYSSAPCTASLATGGTECYNTRSTCQDSANYNKGTLTLRFCKNQAFLPNDGNYYIPSLVSVSLSAGSINPVGANRNSSALGTRGGMSMTFRDHPHTDRYVDPYISNRNGRDPAYIATERGTFWSKWRARNAYYLGRVVRHKSGFIENGQVVDVTTRTFFLTDFTGPSGDGQVQLVAKDILTLFANEKAKAPAASNGRLLNDLDTVHTHIELDPVGVIDEYPASGVIRIGSSLCDYTKAGSTHPNRLNITRGQYGSTANNAKAGDIVQLCKVYTAESPANILEDLLTTYAGIPAGYLDTAQWQAEQTDFMPRLYGTIISEPTGVLDLVAEMCEQMYFYVIWDDREAKLKMRAIRPAQGDTIYPVSDFRNFIADSVTLKDLQDQLVTQVWVYFGLINYAASPTDEKNYAVREIIATNESLPEKQGTEKIKKIFCRWIPSSNGAAAIELGNKMIARYGSPPKQVSFSLTGKDSAIWIGDFCTVSHRLSVDPTGAELPLNIQIMSAQESRPGVEFRYVGQEFVFEAPVDTTEKLIIISADVLNLNLRDEYDRQFSVPPAYGDTIRIEIRPGVVIGGRGYDRQETFIGNVTSVFDDQPARVYSRPLAPLMRRGLGASVTKARGSVYYAPAGNFILMSDVKEVPCSVAFDTGIWPVGVNLSLVQGAGSYIAGESGFSSCCGGVSSVTADFPVTALALASDGGHALRIRHPITWNNQGVISGGGAGGFPAVANFWQNSNFFGKGWLFGMNPGGSGAGRFSRPRLTSVNPFNITDPYYVVNTESSAGGLTAGGYGTTFTLWYQNWYLRATGGAGGDLASVATPPTQSIVQANGAYITMSPIVTHGGYGGYAIIEGASLITWINKGDVRGPEAN